MTELRSPLQAQIVQWLVAPGDSVREGDVLVILEAMKMEHELRATASGRVRELLFSAGETVAEGDLLCISERETSSGSGLQANLTEKQGEEAPRGGLRPDLQRVIDRHAS